MSSVARILDFIEHQGISKSAFYQKTGLSNGYLDKVKDIGSEKIESIVKVYPEINLYWLVMGMGEMLRQKAAETPFGEAVFDDLNETNLQIAGLSTTHKLRPKLQATLQPTENEGSKTIELKPVIVTVDSSGHDNIVHVPVRARAGYLTGYGDPQFIQTLPAYRLPNLRNGLFRMFETEGISMAPTIANRDNVIGQYVESITDIRDGRVYVLITTEGIVIKRVLNRLSRGMLVLKSDTIAHRLEYPTYQISFDTVREIWEAKIKLSADFQEPTEIYTKVNDLEDSVLSLQDTLNRLLFSAPEIQRILGAG